MKPIKIIPIEDVRAACGVNDNALAQRMHTAGVKAVRGFAPRDARKLIGAPKRGRPKKGRRGPRLTSPPAAP